jgi:mono/diheme cytochrome c family protein
LLYWESVHRALGHSAGAIAFAIALVFAGASLLLAGCGGAADATSQAGMKLFNESGCADCHTLTAAAARARIGPDLDALRPSYAAVAKQVRSGGSGMPSFSDRLSDKQIAEIATFVSNAASGTSNSSMVSTAAKFTPDGTKLADCSGSFACIEQAFGNLSYRKGPKVALDEFDRRIAANPEIERNCHRVAHMIGAAALLYYHGSVGKAFAAGRASCWSGYYHGILERAFSGVKSDEVGKVARKLCSDPDVRRTSFIAYQCVHGLGHGLMIYTGYDLPRSLEICDQLQTSWDQTSCTGGVFMENISSSYGITSKWLKDDDPIYPCQVVADRHKLYCYLMVTSRILPLVNWDFEKAAKTCRKSEDGWVGTCYQSLGRDASGQSRGDVARILGICAYADELARECVYGAARDLTSQDSAPGRAAVLCKKAAAGLRDYCFDGIGTILGGLYATDRERRGACEGVSSSEAPRAACRRGAGVG